MNKSLKRIAIAVLMTVTVSSFAQKRHAKISAAQAKKTVLAKYHGTIVGNVELEREDGKWQYAVIVKHGKKMLEVMVDANTGKIGNVEAVTAAEEAREKAEDAKKKGKHGN